MPLLGILIKRFIKARQQILARKISPVKSQKLVLKKLLNFAAHTDFGIHYGFSQIIHSPDIQKEFSNRVPVFNYNSIFKDWWHRALEGEPNICWPGKTKYFALSSGTSEAASKHIPITREMISAIKNCSVKQILSLANYNFSADTYEKGILMLGGSTHLHQKGHYFEGDLSGISASKIPFWFQHFYKPGRKISKEREWEKKLEEIAHKAPGWDIAFLTGVPAWIQIMLEKIISHHKLKTIHDIWPNLVCYLHGGVSFEPYRKGFEKLLAHPLQYVDTYLASEGFIAFQDNPNTRSMKLVLNNGVYFEFLPFDDDHFDSNGDIKEGIKALNIDEVEQEKPYGLLLSTCAGAWRYLIGDVIKFTSVEKSEIVIVGRTKHFLSLCGEHLSVENMNKAIEMTADELNIDIREFTVAGIPYESMFAHQWYMGCEQSVDQEKIKKVLDENLKKLNDDYRVERIAALKDIFVEIIPPDYFYNWHEAHHKMGGQNKFPRVLKKDQLQEWKEFIEKEKSKL